MLRNSYFLLTGALLLAGCGSRQAVQAVDKGPSAISVRTGIAEVRDLERSINVTGSLLADETSTVSSEAPGRVAALNVDFGQPVKKGQVMAQIDTTEIQLQLDRARGMLAQALARIGLDARQEDATVESTPMMRQAQAQLEDARSKYENAARLVKSGDISQERFTELEKAYRARQAAFEMTRDDLRTQMAAIRTLRADVKLAEKRLKDTQVVAPFDGAVDQKLAAVGQYIRENTPIYTVVKSWPLRLRMEVPESAVSQVKVGTTLTFTTEAVPGREFHAVVRELKPTLDARARTLTAEARLTDGGGELRPGAFVQVKLVTAKAEPVVVVPRAALYTVAGLNKLYTIENGKAVEHKIDQILGANGVVELPAGTLAAGAVVATSSVPMLTNGAAVTVQGK